MKVLICEEENYEIIGPYLQNDINIIKCKNRNIPIREYHNIIINELQKYNNIEKIGYAFQHENDALYHYLFLPITDITKYTFNLNDYNDIINLFKNIKKNCITDRFDMLGSCLQDTYFYHEIKDYIKEQTGFKITGTKHEKVNTDIQIVTKKQINNRTILEYKFEKNPYFI